MLELTTTPSETTFDPAADKLYGNDVSETPDAINQFILNDIMAAFQQKGSDVASAGTITLGQGEYFFITGTTTITDIDFTTDFNGRKAWLKFNGILTLTHNATSLILPTGANITTAAGDTCLVVSEGSDNVRILDYNRASGAALAGSGGGMAIGGAVASGTAGSVYFGGTSGALNQDNSNFFWDDTNNKLGIGINSSLAAQIHSKAATGGVALALGSVDANGNLLIYKDSGGTTRLTDSLDGNQHVKHIGPGGYNWFDSANRYFWLTGNDYSSTQATAIFYSVVGTKVAAELKLGGSQSAHAFDITSSGGSGGDLFNVLAGGKVGAYNGVATVSGGVPAEYATVDLTTQGAAIGATTLYAVPSTGAGMYRISWVATVTRAATTSSTLGGSAGFQVLYTDNDDSVVKTSAAAGAPSAGTNQAYSQTNQGNTTASQISGSIIVYAKASTNIQYQFGYTSSGATTMQYNLHIKLEAL